MADPSSPIDALRERVAEALRYEDAGTFIDWSDMVTDPHPVAVEEVECYRHMADAVLDALGLEQIGWHHPGFGLHMVCNGRWNHADCEPIYRLSPGKETG